MALMQCLILPAVVLSGGSFNKKGSTYSWPLLLDWTASEKILSVEKIVYGVLLYRELALFCDVIIFETNLFCGIFASVEIEILIWAKRSDDQLWLFIVGCASCTNLLLFNLLWWNYLPNEKMCLGEGLSYLHK